MGTMQVVRATYPRLIRAVQRPVGVVGPDR